MTPKQFEDQFQRVLEMTNGVAARHGHPPLNQGEVESLRRQCADCWDYAPLPKKPPKETGSMRHRRLAVAGLVMAGICATNAVYSFVMGYTALGALALAAVGINVSLARLNLSWSRPDAD